MRTPSSKLAVAFVALAMPSISALLHTENDALRLGRALETLFPCDEILVVDHDSTDTTPRVAHEYGARIVHAQNGVQAHHYLQLARCDWILCLAPCESLTEALAATLFEWKSLTSTVDVSAYSVFLREETAEGWFQNLLPQVRLVTRTWSEWRGRLPAFRPSTPALEGELLRFSWP